MVLGRLPTLRASSSFTDTVYSGATMANIAADTLYWRTMLRDMQAPPNESAYIDITNPIATVLTRASVAASDTVGYGTAATWYRDNGVSSYGSRIVMPEAGSVTHITYYFVNDTDPFDVKVALYDDSNNVLASGEATNQTAVGGAWITVELDTPYSASSSELLWISCFTTSSSLTAVYYDDISWPVISAWYYNPTSYAAYPADPATRTSTFTVRRFAAYLTYTP
jgi:hypothetical protein